MAGGGREALLAIGPHAQPVIELKVPCPPDLLLAALQRFDLEQELRPDLLRKACDAAGIDLTLNLRPGYDHSYYFVSTFMADHMAWHAARLG